MVKGHIRKKPKGGTTHVRPHSRSTSKKVPFIPVGATRTRLEHGGVQVTMDGKKKVFDSIQDLDKFLVKRAKALEGQPHIANVKFKLLFKDGSTYADGFFGRFQANSKPDPHATPVWDAVQRSLSKRAGYFRGRMYSEADYYTKTVNNQTEAIKASYIMRSLKMSPKERNIDPDQRFLAESLGKKVPKRRFNL